MASTVFFATGAQLAFLVLLLVVLTGILPKGQTLVFAWLTIGSMLFSGAIDMAGSDQTDPAVLLMSQLALSLIYAPSVYLLVKSLYMQLTFRQVLPHYLASVFCFAQVGYFFQSGTPAGLAAPGYKLEILLIIAVIFYYGLQLFLYVQQQVGQYPTDERNVYLRQLALLYLLYHAGQFIVAIALSDTEDWMVAVISEIALILALFYFGFLLIRIGMIHRQRCRLQESVPAGEGVDTQDKLQEVFQQIHRRMMDEQLYLNPHFSLEELSRLEQVNTKYLSQAINTVYGNNFSRYINHFRIEAFMHRAQQPEHQHLSLLSIALDCGFSSKSTFNRVFKEHTGCSPSEWLQTQSKKT